MKRYLLVVFLFFGGCVVAPSTDRDSEVVARNKTFEEVKKYLESTDFYADLLQLKSSLDLFFDRQNPNPINAVVSMIKASTITDVERLILWKIYLARCFFYPKIIEYSDMPSLGKKLDKVTLASDCVREISTSRERFIWNCTKDSVVAGAICAALGLGAGPVGSAAGGVIGIFGSLLSRKGREKENIELLGKCLKNLFICVPDSLIKELPEVLQAALATLKQKLTDIYLIEDRVSYQQCKAYVEAVFDFYRVLDVVAEGKVKDLPKKSLESTESGRVTPRAKKYAKITVGSGVVLAAVGLSVKAVQNERRARADEARAKEQAANVGFDHGRQGVAKRLDFIYQHEYNQGYLKGFAVFEEQKRVEREKAEADKAAAEQAAYDAGFTRAKNNLRQEFGREYPSFYERGYAAGKAERQAEEARRWQQLQEEEARRLLQLQAEKKKKESAYNLGYDHGYALQGMISHEYQEEYDKGYDAGNTKLKQEAYNLGQRTGYAEKDPETHVCLDEYMTGHAAGKAKKAEDVKEQIAQAAEDAGKADGLANAPSRADTYPEDTAEDKDDLFYKDYLGNSSCQRTRYNYGYSEGAETRQQKEETYNQGYACGYSGNSSIVGRRRQHQAEYTQGYTIGRKLWLDEKGARESGYADGYADAPSRDDSAYPNVYDQSYQAGKAQREKEEAERIAEEKRIADAKIAAAKQAAHKMGYSHGCKNVARVDHEYAQEYAEGYQAGQEHAARDKADFARGHVDGFGKKAYSGPAHDRFTSSYGKGFTQGTQTRKANKANARRLAAMPTIAPPHPRNYPLVDFKNPDYYKVLGVESSADESQIKKSYRMLALKNHPDKNPGDKEAEERFKSLAAAYAVLYHLVQRSEYDQQFARYKHDLAVYEEATRSSRAMSEMD